ncbi:MAG: outer membrane protein assembly factor BamB [Paraglaciecola sp.]|jgi:outer membrane protein assembly factor BamB
MVKMSLMKRSYYLPLLVISVFALSACSTVTDWFVDEDELEIRKLTPIEAQFTPTTLWSADLGSGIGQYYSRLKPAVAYGKVYGANRQGTVSAFDEDTGKKVWSKNYAQHNDEGLTSGVTKLWSSGISAKIAGGLSVAYETVFFGTENGEVIALNAQTGKQLWLVNVKGEVLAAPAVDEGIVLVNTGSGVMFALDAGTGEQLWSYESDVPPLSLRGVSAPAAANGGAIIGTASGKLAVNIIGTGQTAWEQVISAPTGATELERIVDIDSQPLLAGDTIYIISYGGSLASVELRSGRVIWKREYKSYRRITMQGNKLFVVDVNSNIFALDRRNGIELWSQSGLKQRQLTAGTPVGDYIVAGDKYGYLHWLNQSDGQVVARLAVGNDDEDQSIYSAPVVEGEVIYTQTRDGMLVAVQTP